MPEELKRLVNTTALMRAFAEAIQAAIEGGMSIEDVKAALEKTAELMDEE